METPVVRWLDRAPGAWAALLASDPSASPSHRPEVWAAFTAAQPGLELRLCTVESEGRLIGGAPVLVERRGAFHWLHAMPMLLSGAPLAMPGEHARVDDTVAGAFSSLARELGVVGGEWALYRPGAPAMSEAALERVGGESRMLEASIVDLTEGIDAPLRRMSRKHRQAMRQARERGLVFAEDAASLEAAYALHVAQARRWSGHRALPLALSQRLLRESDPAARLFTLRRGGELVSAALALHGAHETFVWWSGTREEGRRLHAFPLLLWEIVEWAAARGVRRVNLGASTGLNWVASFKQSLGAETERYPVRWLDARHAPPHARALAAAQAWWRRSRARGEAA